jgi:succinate dehydrogenase / fumarate reductase membrane anchor subunit
MRNRGLTSGGAFAWFFQRISGIVLLLMLLTHFILMHYSGMTEITFDQIKVRLASPFWKIFDLCFLLLGTYHAINGFFMLLHDYVQNNTWRGILTGALWTLGLVMVVIGSLTIMRIGIAG